jgi:heat shock protein HslJ
MHFGPSVLAAGPAADSKDTASKLAGEWRLVKLGEEKVPADAKITLNVAAEGRISGSTGVNRFFGGFAKEKTIFGAIGMTKIAGPPEAAKREAAYVKALGEVTHFELQDDQLTFSASEKPRLIFERAKPAEPR